MNNFRDLDVHTVSEWVLAKGESLVVAVDCDNEPARNCKPAVSFVGRLSG